MTREMAYLAYHFHWGREEILALPHAERRLWVAEVGRLNESTHRDESP